MGRANVSTAGGGHLSASDVTRRVRACGAKDATAKSLAAASAAAGPATCVGEGDRAKAARRAAEAAANGVTGASVEDSERPRGRIDDAAAASAAEATATRCWGLGARGCDSSRGSCSSAAALLHAALPDSGLSPAEPGAALFSPLPVAPPPPRDSMELESVTLRRGEPAPLLSTPPPVAPPPSTPLRASPKGGALCPPPPPPRRASATLAADRPSAATTGRAEAATAAAAAWLRRDTAERWMDAAAAAWSGRIVSPRAAEVGARPSLSLEPIPAESSSAGDASLPSGTTRDRETGDADAAAGVAPNDDSRAAARDRESASGDDVAPPSVAPLARASGLRTSVGERTRSACVPATSSALSRIAVRAVRAAKTDQTGLTPPAAARSAW